MKILIVSQWYPPEPVFLGELAETLRDLGHEVEVLTGFPNYPQGKLYPGYRQQVVKREIINDVAVVRVPLYPEHSRSAIGRFLNYGSFALSATVVGLFATRKPDAIFVYGSPYTTALPGWAISRVKRAPFVFHLVDLWPETLVPTGMINSRLALRLIGSFARFVYRSAAAVIVASNGFRRALFAAGVPEAKTRVIPNWVDVDHYTPVGIDRELRRELGFDDRFVVMYAGTIGAAQGLETVIDAAALLRNDDAIRFVFVGDGVDLPVLQAKAKALGLDNVAFLGRYSSSEIVRIYTLADVLLVHLKPDPRLAGTIPHKIFAYMATGKPVLAAVGGDAATVIEEGRGGVTCEPGSAEALAAAVRHLAALSPEERARMGANGRETALTRYSRSHLVGQIEAYLHEIVSQRGRKDTRS